MGLADDYAVHVLSLLEAARTQERDALAAAAAAIADALSRGGRWWLFGTGHSHLLVEEVWGRAGGLVDVEPILEPAVMLHEGLSKSSRLERLPGLAAALIEEHPVAAGDVALVISNTGRNALPVEFATLAAERGAATIALTSVAASRSVPSRAPSGKRLEEVCAIVIDNHGVPGDAIIPRAGASIAPTSTVVGAFLLQLLVCEVVERMDASGHPPRILESLNS